MQFLIATSLLVAGSSAQLVYYSNGAVAPYDPANAAATAAHLEATAEAGKLINPFGVHATGLYHGYGKRAAEAQVFDAATGLVTYANGAVVPLDPANQHLTAAHLGLYGYGYHHGYGKREAQVLDSATGLVTYPNGAVAPFDPNVALATANHYAAKAAHGYYPYVGAANVHPAAYLYGRKKREAQVPVSLVTGFAHTPYLGYFGHHVAPVVAPFTAHPNGALVPQEPADVVEARAAHLAAVAEAGRKKREAQVPVSLVTGFAHTPYFGYFGHHVAPVVAPFTAHPNGALVPQEPADVVEARAAHLAAVAEAGK